MKQAPIQDGDRNLFILVFFTTGIYELNNFKTSNYNRLSLHFIFYVQSGTSIYLRHH